MGRPTEAHMAKVLVHGRHSNIPECCIWWFGHVRLRLPACYKRIQARFIGALNRPPRHQYVRCPACLILRRWSTQHICGWSCCGEPGHTHWRCPDEESDNPAHG